MSDCNFRHRVLLALAAWAAMTATALTAQEKTDTTSDTTRVKQPVVLQPLEVTAAREHAAPPPVATVDLSGAVLERTQSENPYDLFRRAAAVEVHEQGQGPGFASDVVVRGFTSDHSGDVLLVVDGVPVNLPINGHGEGYSDWNSLQPEAVSSLRLIHGPSSPLYGDFALAGVVEAFTSADAEGTTVSVTGSSYGDIGGWLRSGSRGDSSGGMLALSGKRDEGWRDNSQYWLMNGLLRGWRRAGSDGRIEGGLGVYTTEWHSPGFISVDQYNAGDLEHATDPTDGGSSTRVVAHGRYATLLGGRTAFESTLWGFGSTWNLFLNIPEGDGPVSQTGEHDDRTAIGAQATLSWLPSSGEFTFGIAGRTDWASYSKFQTVRRTEGAAEDDIDATYTSGSLFARYRRTFGNRFGLDLGGRVDVLDYGSKDFLSGVGHQEDTRAIVSPKLGARYILSPSVSLLASASHGFRGAPGVIGDPARPPLTAWALETGFEWKIDRVDAQLSGFRTTVSNERIVDPITNEITSAGSSVRQGIDGRARVRLFGLTSLTVAGTWTDAHLTGEFADAHTESLRTSMVVSGDSALQFPCADPTGCLAHHEEGGVGTDVPGVAEYTISGGITTVIASRVPVGLAARVLGPYTPIGEPDVRTKPYVVFDLTSNIPLGAGLEADIGIQNLFDRKYPEIRSSGFINPGAPLTVRASLIWTPPTQ